MRRNEVRGPTLHCSCRRSSLYLFHCALTSHPRQAECTVKSLARFNRFASSRRIEMSNDMISTRELLRLTGIKDRRTLEKWSNLGLIPEAEIRTIPGGGRGRSGYYPRAVIEICK